MNERIRFFDQDGKSILLLDVSGLAPGADFKNFISTAKKVIQAQPKQSVLTLFDANNSFFDTEMIDILKEFTVSNKPYVKASAVVGIKGLKKMMLDLVSKFSGRTFKQCDTREEAARCLAQQ